MIKKILLTILGTFCLALSAGLFIIPNNILSGGVAGISVAISPLISFVSKEYISSFITIAMFIVGSLVLGKDFAMKTLISSLIYPPLLLLITSTFKPIELDPILATLYGGLLGGIGLGIVFRQGGSTGGMDVPPLILNKFFGIKVSNALLLTDGLSILLGLVYYGLLQVLLGFIAVYCTSYGCGKMISLGGTKSKEFKIISDKYVEIADEIHKKVDRGTTILYGEGGYTHEKRKILLCVVEEGQYQEVLDVVNNKDSKAFVVVTDINDVHGEGFSFAKRI